MLRRPGGAARAGGKSMNLQPSSPLTASASLLRNRWVQLTAGIIGMIAVANFQYSWTLFVGPLHRKHGWSEESIKNALYLFFISAQTWLVPLEGYLADRFGPRRLLLTGGVLAGLAWVVNAYTDSLAVLYASQVVAGCGSGIVYGLSMGSAVKWFPDRRGLAVGLMAAAFGAGSAATVLPISWTINNPDLGFATAFIWFGLGQGLVIVLAGIFMRFPRPGEVAPPVQPKVLQTVQDYTPREMLRTPAFWLLYIMMTLGAIPGLLMIGDIASLAEDYHLTRVPVSLFGLTLAALPFAMMLDRVMGGLTRPVFGWISDHIGREVAIFLAFALEGVSLLLLILFIHQPVMFVLMSGIAFFGWGAVFSLFPAVSGDMFGRKFATANYGLLYTAKGAATLLVSLLIHLQARASLWWRPVNQDLHNLGHYLMQDNPLGAVAASSYQLTAHAPTEQSAWHLVFGIMIALDFTAAFLALFVLRPLRRRAAVKTMG
jgi:OFA family oxalate/formate antiporter-like MFS transporter